MIKIEKNKGIRASGNYRLRVDDQVYDSRSDVAPVMFFNIGSPDSNIFVVDTRDETLSKKVAAHRINEIPEDIKSVTIANPYRIESRFLKAPSVTLDRHQMAVLEWVLDLELKHWKFLYSPEEFINEIGRLLEAKGLRHFQILRDTNLFLRFVIQDKNSTLEAELLKACNQIQSSHDQAITFLSSKHPPHSVAMSFDFPEAVAVPCEQYLLYFAQFLKDLGVEAETALTHEAGKVLFTVTPRDRAEALDKIQSALELYLKLPTNPITDSGTSESIEVQRLESNILRLRGDLKLAAAEVQAKDATIRAQNLIIDVHTGLLSGEILLKSVRDVTPKPEDQEDVIPGILALSTYEEKGVRLNLGELLRRLKTFFSNS
jgi:hypothetical protein